MRKLFSKFALAAAFGLALTFTFSCSGGGDSTDNWPGGDGTSSPSSGGGDFTGTKGTFKDSRDSKSYKWVKIGEQYWLAENLNYDVPSNDTDICYDNNPANCLTYGRLYNWATAMDLSSKCNSTFSTSDADCAIKTPNHRGICPTDWHIPSRADWDELRSYVDNDNGCSNCEGKYLKATSGWNENGESDKYGFTALPGGMGQDIHDGDHDGIDAGVYFNDIGKDGFWWSASEIGSSGKSAELWYFKESRLKSDDFNKRIGLSSIRCVKDN